MGNILKKKNTQQERELVIKPVVDIIENQNSVVLQAELPGVGKDDLDIEVKNNTLSIHARKKKDAAEEQYAPLYQERYTAVAYHRDFQLNSEIDHQNIKANLKDGLLTVTLAKSTDSQPKKIAIEPSS